MVTRAICPRLVRQGHEIEILGWQQRSAAAYWEGIPIRPVRHDTFGADVLHGYLMRFLDDGGRQPSRASFMPREAEAGFLDPDAMGHFSDFCVIRSVQPERPQPESLG